MVINLIKTVKTVELKLGKKVKTQNNENPSRKIRKPSPKVRPLLFYLATVVRSRIGMEYSTVSILPTSWSLPIEGFYVADFAKTNPLVTQNRIKIQSGNHNIIVETNHEANKKLMTLGEFEFKRGIDPDGKIPSSKTRNLSKIYKLKRNQVGSLRKLRKENQSLETVSLDESNSAEVNPKISIVS